MARSLTVVQIEPDYDVLPVRAEYDGSGSRTIGLNHLTSEPLWYTLADCVAAKLQTGRSPKVRRSISFRPKEPQRHLRPVRINGNRHYELDPYLGDFYRQLIELRQEVKGRRDCAPSRDRDRLDADQNAIKIAANATSYGIFAEVNVREEGDSQPITVYAADAVLQRSTDKLKEPGRFFHPLLASAITGAARLMLTIGERLITDAGLEWMFCDTDSMAIARPPEMERAELAKRADDVVGWFSALNPYAFSGPLLKIEDVNLDVSDGGRREPLFGYAVSAKRCVLFNLDGEGNPILRKASAHGLGHLRPPYDAENPSAAVPPPMVKPAKIGVALWQHDLWWRIAKASLDGPVTVLPFDHHPAMSGPALSRYAATTPAILRWFNSYNDGRLYDEQVKPFGFLNAFSSPRSELAPVAPFDRDNARSAALAFDRNSGSPAPFDSLQSCSEALAQYHLHPESKFENGSWTDHGETDRRHFIATGATYIGKEADRLEEQFFLGADPGSEINYGATERGAKSATDQIKRAQDLIGQRQLAIELGIPRETLRSRASGQQMRPSDVDRLIARRLAQVLKKHAEREREQASVFSAAREEVNRVGLTALATRLRYDPANLRNVLSGKRPPSAPLLRALRADQDLSNASAPKP